MARDIDVYQLVRAFASKNNLSSVDYSVFSRAIQRQAGQSDQSEPIYRDLAINPDSILVPRLYKLAKERRLAIELIGGELATIVMPEHYVNVFAAEYRRMDDSAELPFPDEEGLRITVPPEWIQPVNVETDLAHLSSREVEPSVPLYRLIFSGGLKTFVIPQAFVPEKLLEYSVLKLRLYLRQGANREYIQNKLLYAFAAKEVQLKEVLGAVLTKPYEAISELKASSSDLIFPFWAHLASHIKRDLDKKPDKTPEDHSIYQAAIICEFYAGWYKAKAKRVIDLELALRAFDQAIRKPPFNFGIDDMASFRDAQGQPLLGRLSSADIEAYLKAKTTELGADGLPELFVLALGQGRRVYIAADRSFPLFYRLLSEARSEARSVLIAQWTKALEEFKVLPAMEDGDQFRKELALFVASRFPLMDAMLKDRFLPLLHDGLVAKGSLPPDVAKLFYKGELLPLDNLLELDRKSLVVDARILLPFWYSVSLFAGIVRLFRRLGQSKPEKKAKAPPSPAPAPAKEASGQTLKARRAAFAAAAQGVEAALVPAGYSLDEYLQELEGRWNYLLNPQAKADLREDVNSLIRDYLRSVLKTLQPSSLTKERIRGLAATIADRPALLKIKNHAALELYVQLYMLKSLKS